MSLSQKVSSLQYDNAGKVKSRKGIHTKDFAILFFAILSEVIGTTALKFPEGFTKLIPSVVVLLGYGLSFYLLSLSLKVFPVGIAYAIWSGVGLVLIVTAGMLIWRETLDWARVVGILLILAGIILINVFSKSTVH